MFQFGKIIAKPTIMRLRTLATRMADSTSHLGIFSKSKLEKMPVAVKNQLTELAPNGKIFKWETLKDGRIKVWTKNGKSVTRSIFTASDSHRLVKTTNMSRGTALRTYHTKDNVWLQKGYNLLKHPRQTFVANSVPGQKSLPKIKDMTKRNFKCINGINSWTSCEENGIGFALQEPLPILGANGLANVGKPLSVIEEVMRGPVSYLKNSSGLSI